MFPVGVASCETEGNKGGAGMRCKAGRKKAGCGHQKHKKATQVTRPAGYDDTLTQIDSSIYSSLQQQV